MEIKGQPISLLVDEPQTRNYSMGSLRQMVQYKLPRREYLQMEGLVISTGLGIHMAWKGRH